MKLTLAICLLMTSINSHAALNKWIDSEGKVHYSDTAPGDVKIQKLKSPVILDSGTQGSNVLPQKSLAEREADWEKEQKRKEDSAKKSAQKQEAASLKQKNCETARSNLANYEKSPAMVTYDANGEGKMLDDAAKNRGTEEARKAVSTYCN